MKHDPYQCAQCEHIHALHPIKYAEGCGVKAFSPRVLQKSLALVKLLPNASCVLTVAVPGYFQCFCVEVVPASLQHMCFGRD